RRCRADPGTKAGCRNDRARARRARPRRQTREDESLILIGANGAKIKRKLAMDPFLGWIETSALATWVRGESVGTEFVFPIIVTLHTIGMGFLAGGSTAIGLRILGIASNIPLKPMARFVPLLWLAFAVNAVS